MQKCYDVTLRYYRSISLWLFLQKSLSRDAYYCRRFGHIFMYIKYMKCISEIRKNAQYILLLMSPFIKDEESKEGSAVTVDMNSSQWLLTGNQWKKYRKSVVAVYQRHQMI